MTLDDGDDDMLLDAGNQASEAWAAGSTVRGLNTKDGRGIYDKAARQTGITAVATVTEWRRYDDSVTSKFRKFATDNQPNKDSITVQIVCIINVDQRVPPKEDGKPGRIESLEVENPSQAIVEFPKETYFQCCLDAEAAAHMLTGDPNATTILHVLHTLYKEARLNADRKDTAITALVEARTPAIQAAQGIGSTTENDRVLALLSDDGLWESKILPTLFYRNVLPYTIPDTSSGRTYEQKTLDRNPPLNPTFNMESALKNYEILWVVVKAISEWTEHAMKPSRFVARGVPKPDTSELEKRIQEEQDPQARAALEAERADLLSEIRWLRFSMNPVKYENGYTPAEGDLVILDGLKQKVGGGLRPFWRQDPETVLELRTKTMKMRFCEVGTMKVEARFDPRCIVPFTIRNRQEVLLRCIRDPDGLLAECERISKLNPLDSKGKHESGISILMLPTYMHQTFLSKHMEAFEACGGITIVGIEASGADAKANKALWLTNSDAKPQAGKETKPSEPCIEASIVGLSAMSKLCRKLDHNDPNIAALAQSVLNGRMPMHQPQEGEVLPSVSDGVYAHADVKPVVLFGRIFKGPIRQLCLPGPVNDVWLALGPLLSSCITGIVRIIPNPSASTNMGNVDRQSEKVRQATSAATGFLATLPVINVAKWGPHYVVPKSLVPEFVRSSAEQKRIYIPTKDNVVQSLKYSPIDVYLEASVPISPKAAEFLLTSGSCKARMLATPSSLTGEDYGKDFTFVTMAADVGPLVNRNFNLYFVGDVFPNSPAYRQWARELPTEHTDKIFCAAYANKSADQRIIYVGELLQKLPKVRGRLSPASIVWDPQRTPFLIVAINASLPSVEEAMRIYTEKRMKFAGMDKAAKEVKSSVQIEEMPDETDRGADKGIESDQREDGTPPAGKKRKREDQQQQQQPAEDDDLIIVDKEEETDDVLKPIQSDDEQADAEENPFHIEPKRSKRA
jgi:hypothetical protein